ncbi:MAG: hypothetical protein QOF98_826, partial [Streptomyces sp.]|nr:hypothetical protein [Streptomyces sp.]
ANSGAPGHHLAAQYGAAGERLVRSAGLLYRRELPSTAAPHDTAWTAAGWTAYALAEYPGCRTAAAVLSRELCVLRIRGDDLPRSVHVEPHLEHGHAVFADPAAALSAVHAWATDRKALPSELTCLLGDRAFRVRVTPATADEAASLF